MAKQELERLERRLDDLGAWVKTLRWDGPARADALEVYPEDRVGEEAAPFAVVPAGESAPATLPQGRWSWATKVKFPFLRHAA